MSLQSYFYDQRRKNRPQKRIKKSADDYSIFGDHRSFTKSIKKKVSLTFSDQGDTTDGAASTVASVHGIVPTRPKSSKNRPPSAKQTSPSKEATLKTTLQLPHIPSNLSAGPTSPPNIVAQSSKQLLKKDIKLSPANQKVLEAVEAEGPDQDKHRHPNYTFSELKFLATGILSQLSKLLLRFTQNKPEDFHASEDLESELLRDYYQLCANVIVEKREWQTDCYLDQAPEFSRPFFTSVPEEEERKLIELKRAEVEQKKVKMSEAAKKLYAAKSPTSRPATSHSRASLHSAISSDVGGISTVEDDRESRLAPSEYDMLPLSLCPKGPTILSYRRESTSKPFEFSGPKTRFEKFKQNVNANRRGKNAKRIDVNASTNLIADTEKIEETEQEKPQEEVVTTMHHGSNMINFSMCDKYLKKGWIVCPDERKDPEGFTLLQWAKERLSKILEQKSEAELVAKQRGEDGPLIIRFYDEYGNRAHRRQTKTIVLPVPPGVRIGVAKTTVQVPVEPQAELSNTGHRKRFLTLLRDGSGFCNYLSGNKGISTCRKGDGSRGLYAFVYSDEAYPKMLAWFTPYGKMACYYHNGNLRMLANSEGGRLMDEDGHVTRQWKWPTVTCKLPQSVLVQLNAHITFRCYSHVNAFLHFSSHGVSYKFDVGTKQELKDSEIVESASSFLMTDFKFSSYAAAEVSGKPTNLVKKRHHGVTPKVSFSRASSISENVFHGEKNSAEDEIIAEELSTYQEKIKSLVDSWQGHYRCSLGIKKTPTMISKASKPSLLNRSQTASPRSVFSFDDGGELLSRAGTRMSSRPHSRSSTYPMSPRPVSDFGFVDSVSPQPETNSTTVNSRIILKRSPSKVTPTKPKIDVSIQKVISGCPEAVRVMKLNGLSLPPQCKCIKHKLPLICDYEFDTFLESHVPSDQLVLVYVTLTSSVEKPNPTEAMLDAIHVKQHRNRSSPCLQLSKENFRILKYDLATCADPSNSGLPLLVQRHNIQSGMFLMYFNGRLVMADNTFNGYSNKKKDLQKQIEKSINDGKKGHFLPKDFKLHGETQQLHRIMKLNDPEPSFVSLLDDSLSASHSGVDTLLSSMHKMGTANKAGSPLQEKPPVVRRLSTQLNIQHTS